MARGRRVGKQFGARIIFPLRLLQRARPVHNRPVAVVTRNEELAAKACVESNNSENDDEIRFSLRLDRTVYAAIRNSDFQSVLVAD